MHGDIGAVLKQCQFQFFDKQALPPTFASGVSRITSPRVTIGTSSTQQSTVAGFKALLNIMCLPERKGLWRVAILKTLSNMLVTVIINR
jgi:hypothetical protein